MAKKYTESVFYDKRKVIGMKENMMTQKDQLEHEMNELIHTANSKRGEEKVIEAKVTGITSIGDKPVAIATFGSGQISCMITMDEYMDFPAYNENMGYTSENKMRKAYMQSTQWAVIDIALLPPRPNPEDPSHMTNNIRIDEESGLIGAFCSRKIAMDRQYQDYWLPKGDGKRIINPGCYAIARIFRVANTCVFAECFGVEFQIPLHELSWNRLSYAQEAFSAGDEVQILIKDIQYSDDEKNVRPYVVASIKDAQENPQIKAFPLISENSSESGIVKNPHNGKFFVTLDRGKAEVYCDQGANLFRTPMSGDKCVVMIDGKDPETLRIWGTIVRLEEKKLSRPTIV